MPSMLVTLSPAHVQDLVRRDEARAEVVQPQNVPDVVLADVSQDGPLLRGATLTAFVQRCIGTAIELQAHQSAGGAVLLQYADGTLKELVIDLGHDGTTLPRIVEAPPRPRRIPRLRPRPKP